MLPLPPSARGPFGRISTSPEMIHNNIRRPITRFSSNSTIALIPIYATVVVTHGQYSEAAYCCIAAMGHSNRRHIAIAHLAGSDCRR